MISSQKKVLSICLALVASYFPGQVRAQSLESDKFSDWKESLLPKMQAYRAYTSTAPDVIANAKPYFNGWVFFLQNYNQETFRNVTDVKTFFETHTIVTTNTNVSSFTSYNTYDLFNTSFTTSSMTGNDWVAARATYLENNFGMNSGDAIATALSERSFCETNPADCAGRSYTTDYRLDFLGPNTTVTTNPSTTSIASSTTNNTTTTNTGNTAVTTTVTNNNTTTTTVDSTTTETTTGTRDTTTSATAASGGGDGTVDSQTQVDERTTVDEETTETTTTEERTEEKTDKETTTTSERRVKGEKHWDIQIAPMIFFNFDYDRNITSLASYYPSISRFTFDEEGRIVNSLSSTNLRPVINDNVNSSHNRQQALLNLNAQNNGPYKVQLQHDAMLGVGAVLQFVQVNASGIAAYMIPYIGVAPTASISAKSERFTKSLIEAKKVKHLNVPRNAQELLQWKDFEKITYTSQGGILFIGGVSFPGLNIGANYIANGSWTTEIQRIAKNRVYVKVSSGKLSSLGVQGSVGLLGLSSSKFSALNNSFSYMFDLANPQAQAAYLQLIKGNAKAAQVLASDSKVKSVIPVDSSNLKAAGKIRSLKFGIPFANMTSMQGKILSAEMSDYYPDKTKISADYGIYLREKSSKFFGLESSYTYGFYGSAYSLSKKNEKAENGDFGMIGWSYKTSEVDEAKLRRAIQKLVLQTGMRNELGVQVAGGSKNKGYASLDFSLKLSEDAGKILIQIADQKDGLEQFNRISSGFIESVFSSDKTSQAASDLVEQLIEEYAPQSSAQVGNKPTTQPMQSRSQRIAHAKRQLLQETADAMLGMQRSLQWMRHSKTTKNRKEFVKHYAEFGKNMLKNQFAFQTAFNLVKGRGVSARYTISGESIKAYDLEFNWKPHVEARR